MKKIVLFLEGDEVFILHLRRVKFDELKRESDIPDQSTIVAPDWVLLTADVVLHAIYNQNERLSEVERCIVGSISVDLHQQSLHKLEELTRLLGLVCRRSSFLLVFFGHFCREGCQKCIK